MHFILSGEWTVVGAKMKGGNPGRKKPGVQGKSDGSLDYVDGESRRMLRLKGLGVM